jgi:chromosome segregation ATPase
VPGCAHNRITAAIGDILAPKLRGGGRVMSEFSWETEQQHPPAAEHEPKQSPAPETISLSASDFAAIEERIVRAVELVRRERQLRSEAEARAASAEARVEQADTALREQMASADELGKELAALRTERNEVKERVERLLSQLDALEL